MSKKMIRRILFSILTIILVIGLGWYSYSLIRKRTTNTPDNLFSLVPQTAFAIWETENFYEVVSKLRKSSYHTQYDSLGISDLLVFLINNIEEISDEEGHRNNPYIKELVVSFHPPHSSRDQVLYLKTEEHRRSQIEKLIRKLSLNDFSPKTLKYRDEDIIIYPFRNNEFISCYHHPSFTVVSYQAKLIEKVIDSYLDKNSVMSDSIFSFALENKKGHSESTLFLQEYPILFKRDIANGVSSSINLPGQWIEFDLITNRDAIYLAGNSFARDSVQKFSSALQEQKPVKLLSSQFLPESTFLFNQLAITDLGKVASLINDKPYPVEACSDFTARVDSAMFAFLHENAMHTICNFTFHTETQDPFSSIIYVPLHDRKSAESSFRNLQLNWGKEQRNNRYIYPKYHFGRGSFYSIYEAPDFPLLHYFTNIPIANIDNYYTCFYKDGLLISPFYNSLTCYIDCLDTDKTKENDQLYQECISGLAPESNVVFISDLGEVMERSEHFDHVIPKVFFDNPEFFRHFILIVQYTTNEDKLSPNISLIYKGEEV